MKSVPKKNDSKETTPSMPVGRQQFLLKEAELAKARLEIVENLLNYLVILRDSCGDRANLALLELQKGRETDSNNSELAELKAKLAELEAKSVLKEGVGDEEESIPDASCCGCG
jgi:hypothetical protein